MNTRIFSILAISVSAVAATACNGDPGGSTMVTADASVVADAATVGSGAVTSDANLMMPSGTNDIQPASFDDDNPSAGCTVLLLRWNCPVRVSGGLSVASAITFYDSTGAAQSSFNALTTASMHIDADISGSVQHGSWQADVARHHHFVVTGMLGVETTRTWNGTGSDTLQRTRVTDSTGTRQYEVTVNTTLHDVVMQVHGGRRPISGSATQVITMTQTVGPQAGNTFTFTATYTFNGSASVPFLVGSRHFHLDMDADATAEDH